MKRTTYLFIALFCSGIVLILAMAACFLLGGVEKPTSYTGNLKLEGAATVRQLPSFRVLELSCSLPSQGMHRFWVESGELKIRPAGNEGNALTLPEAVEHALSTTLHGDTLKAVLQLSDTMIVQTQDLPYVLNMAVGDWELALAPGVECIVNRMAGQRTVLQGMACDSLAISGTHVAVDSCRMGAFNVQDVRTLKLQSGDIRSLYFNLDFNPSWTVDVEKCRVGTECFSGSGKMNVTLDDGCKQMRWMPSNKDATLTLELKKAADVSFSD